MSDHSPRVSIGVPVYNGERFVDQTIRCLLNQTFTDFEIVISDNASTDRTSELCRAFGRLDGRIRYVRSDTNIGAARNLMKAVELSSAPYFKLANADDLCGPTLVADCVSILDRHPAVVLCYGKTLLIDDEGAPIRRYEDGLHLRMPDAATRFLRAAERVRLVNTLQGVMRTDVAKRVFARHGSYDGADEVLVAALALHGEIHELPKALFFRRMHAAASSAIKGHRDRRAFLDPHVREIVPIYLWRLFGGHFKAIAHAHVPISDKIGALSALVRLAVRDRDRLAGELCVAIAHLVRAHAANREHA
jgi:glycosyltransferase involved in cell wall biosynthesis